MASWSWSLLNIIAWSVGLKAVYDLRREHAPRALTWSLMVWALWFCLVMELAMLAASLVTPLQILSVTTGIVSAGLIGASVRSLFRDLHQEVETIAGKWLEPVATGVLMVLALAAVVAASVMPTRTVALAGLLRPLEGATWLVVSAALVPVLMRTRLEPWQKHVFAPERLAFAFVLSFLGSALTPTAWLFSVVVQPEAGPLFSTLFLLTLVAALYGMVIRLRGHKLTMAMSQVHGYEQQLLVLEKIAAVSTLAAGAAHDFKNALTAIVGFAEMALENPNLSDQTRADIEQVRLAGRSATALAEGLLGVARRQRGDVPLRDVKDAVLQPLSLLERELRRNNILIIHEVDDAISPVGIELGALSQVCLNLYLNARDAMLPKGGGTLTVSVAASDTEVVVVVRDTGTGIPPDFQQRLFEPLQTTKGDRGTGLGLSVSKQVVTAAGGRIAFTTEEGRGTEFRIHLPVLRSGTPSLTQSEAGETAVAFSTCERTDAFKRDSVEGTAVNTAKV